MAWRILIISGFLLVTMNIVSPMIAFAQEEPQTNEEAKESQTTQDDESDADFNKAREEFAKTSEERLKLLQKTEEKTREIAADLDIKERQHFQLVYLNYNLIQTVEIVQNDVSAAVKACAENNPETKDKLETRFDVWQKEVGGALGEAKGQLDNMLAVQEYAPKKEFDTLFSLLDQTRDKTNAQIEKVPVTTPQACEFLYNKLDETQEKMVTLLRRGLVSYPQTMPSLNEAVQEENAQKENAQSEESETENAETEEESSKTGSDE